MLPLLLLPLSVGSEPPAFEVTNKVPPFVVVNKVDPTPAAPTYADVYARVLKGERVTWEGSPPGMPRGVYECWMQNGSPVMRLVPPAVAVAPAVPDCPPGQT